jgi:hypothetical protein|nr:MAG TPA: hypothetical protein [Caudoviricetes sp.]
MKTLEEIKFRIKLAIKEKIKRREAKRLAVELCELLEFYVMNDLVNDKKYKDDLDNNEIIKDLIEEIYGVLEGIYE